MLEKSVQPLRNPAWIETDSMKIALVHQTAWPHPGSVENLIFDQANLLQRHGHEVTVFAGKGEQPGADWKLELLPELAPHHELGHAVQNRIWQGQLDGQYAAYRQLLEDALTPRLAEADAVLVHEHFTSAKNLTLTHAMHELAKRRPVAGWVHSVSSAAAPWPAAVGRKTPWSFLTQSSPHIHYVVPNELTALQLTESLSPAPKPHLIPPLVDPARVLGLTPEIQASLPELDYANRDFVFLLPAKLQPQKNLEQALQWIEALIAQEYNPLLFITGVADSDLSKDEAYAQFLRRQIAEKLSRHVVIISDHLPVNARLLQDLYRVCDCLLNTSLQESIGTPVLEAGWHRLPIWSTNTPALAYLHDSLAFRIDSPADLTRAVAWLEMQPSYQSQSIMRPELDPEALYQKHYRPFLESLAPSAAAIKPASKA